MSRSTKARRHEDHERVNHGHAGAACQAREAPRWPSCPPQIVPRKTVGTADIPCPKVQPVQANRLARIWCRLPIGFCGTCAIVRWSQPRVWQFALCAEYVLPSCSELPNIEQFSTLAVSARLMPVIASPLLAMSSAQAGLISRKPAAARLGYARKPAANVQATRVAPPQSSQVARSQSGFTRGV